MTEILGLDRSLEIVMGGRRMNGIVFPLLILFLVITLVADSSVFSVEKDGIHLQKPSVKNGLIRHTQWRWEPVRSLEHWYSPIY